MLPFTACPEFVEGGRGCVAKGACVGTGIAVAGIAVVVGSTVAEGNTTIIAGVGEATSVTCGEGVNLAIGCSCN
jgi:hypothetical protein